MPSSPYKRDAPTRLRTGRLGLPVIADHVSETGSLLPDHLPGVLAGLTGAAARDDTSCDAQPAAIRFLLPAILVATALLQPSRAGQWPLLRWCGHLMPERDAQRNPQPALVTDLSVPVALRDDLARGLR